MKKIINVLLSCILLLSISGCGKADTNEIFNGSSITQEQENEDVNSDIKPDDEINSENDSKKEENENTDTDILPDDDTSNDKKDTNDDKKGWTKFY